MRVLFLNLPHAQRIVRRYICTYNSPLASSPPHDLIWLATCVREWNGAEVSVLDAIAENLSEDAVKRKIEEFRPDAVMALLGIESVSTDLSCIQRLKAAYPEARFCTFGYYATIYAEEILSHGGVDAVIRSEPEESFSAYLEAWSKGEPLRELPGVAAKGSDGAVFVNPFERIADLNRLPNPDYGLVDIRLYEELMLGRPFAFVQTARGCPYSCAFCVTTYGHRLALRDAERVVDELEDLYKRGVRVARFLDDTFTHSKKRVIAICQEMLRRNIRLRWGCLARLDTLDAEMLGWMKKAGCARVVVGIESYSHRVLELLGKNLDPSKTNERLEMIRDAGIPSMGLIMVGGPFEKEEDFEATRRGLLESPLDYVLAYVTTVYGGTPLFERLRDQVHYNLLPYECRWKDESITETGYARERRIYRDFFLRPRILTKRLWDLVRFPLLSLRLMVVLCAYLIRPRRRRDREDFI